MSFTSYSAALDREEQKRANDAVMVVLAGKWCDCEADTGFHSYPEDGACPCGVYKHHVHGLCGRVTQVG